MQSGTSFSSREFFYFTPPLSLDNPSESQAYLTRRIVLSIVGAIVTLAYLTVVSFTDARGPFISIAGASGNIYISFLIFAFALQIALSLLKSPLEFYSDFLLEHRYGLSNQKFLTWLFRKLKAMLVGWVFLVVILTAFYFLLVNFPGTWWLMFAGFFFLFQILVAQLFPTLILPLFYKLKPLDNEPLNSRLRSLVEKSGYKMSGVYSFDLSRETKKANAALTGLGRSRRIIISDTLLGNFSDDEIEVVLAHELGHLVKHHMMKGILVSAVVSLLGFSIMAHIYSGYASRLGLPLQSLAAIPFLALIVAIFGMLAMPLGNLYSRRIEHEADTFAISETGMRNVFADSMRKLGRLNLTPENPPAWMEKIFFSHPSIGARIRFALGTDEKPHGTGVGEVGT